MHCQLNCRLRIPAIYNKSYMYRDFSTLWHFFPSYIYIHNFISVNLARFPRVARYFHFSVHKYIIANIYLSWGLIACLNRTTKHFHHVPLSTMPFVWIPPSPHVPTLFNEHFNLHTNADKMNLFEATNNFKRLSNRNQ